MALVRSRCRDDWSESRRRNFDNWIREPIWNDRFLSNWPDWPRDWPRPRDVAEKFWRDSDRWWNEWPSDWPRMDSIMPRFSSHMDRMDPEWRNSDFWRDIYPRWAEPIFKEGLDVKTNIINDNKRFMVDIDAYQFKPEELQVKTLDDTLVIEGRHEDIKDRDNFTKLYFTRKYQLPRDVDPQSVQSSINSNGRLMVEASKRYQATEGRERSIPIESPSHFRSSSYSQRNRDYGGRDSSRNLDYGGRDSSVQNEGRYRFHEERDRDRYEYRNGIIDNIRSPPLPTNDFRCGEYSSKKTDDSGMRYESRREEFRSESRNGYSSHYPENGYHHGRLKETNDRLKENDYRSSSRARDDNLNYRDIAVKRSAECHEERKESRQGFRVDTPGSCGVRDNERGFRVDTPGSCGVRDNERPSCSRSESSQSVRFLRQT